MVSCKAHVSDPGEKTTDSEEFSMIRGDDDDEKRVVVEVKEGADFGFISSCRGPALTSRP